MEPEQPGPQEKEPQEEQPVAGEERHETCIDTEELQLMFQKSPSIVKCEQEQLSAREAIILVIVFFVVTVAVTLGLISGDVMKDRDACLHELGNVSKLLEIAEKDAFVRNMCLKDTCVHTAARFLSDLDSKINPCDDFYKYACAGWQRSNPVPPDQETWGVQEKVEFNIRKDILLTLQKPVGSDANVNSAIKKLKIFYQSCADEEAIDKAGKKLISDAINNIGGWMLQTGRSNWDVTNSLSKLRFSYTSDALFYPFVAPNPYDRTKYAIQIAKAGLGIPNAADYDDKSKPIAKKYMEYMKSIAKELGQSDPNRDTFAQQVFEVEKDLAEIMQQTSGTEGPYENTTIRELESIAGKIKWTEYFNSGGFKVNLDTKVLVASKEYIRRISSLVERLETSKLNNYFVWKLAMSLAMDLPKEFRDAASKYVMASTGTTSPKPRWKYCFNSVESFMNLAVGAVYIKNYFRNKTKDEVSKIVDEMKQAVKDTIETSDWLDDSAKEEATAKIDSLVKKVAYPKILESEAKLNDYYKYISVRSGDPYSDILTTIMRDQTTKMVELLNEPVDKDQWATGLHLTNAYYSRVANEIVLPAGILVSPYFDENSLQFINYAGTGFAIGQKLMKLFDDKADPSMAEVWASTNYTEAFNTKQTCLRGYLNRQGIKDDNPGKAHALTEGMADIGGLAIAYRAYRGLSWKRGDEKVLPGMEKTADQLFFISYAQSWCESTPTRERNSVASGNIPANLRVRTAVSHSNEFASVFDCSWKAPMNVRPKCSMW